MTLNHGPLARAGSRWGAPPSLRLGALIFATSFLVLGAAPTHSDCLVSAAQGRWDVYLAEVDGNPSGILFCQLAVDKTGRLVTNFTRCNGLPTLGTLRADEDCRLEGLLQVGGHPLLVRTFRATLTLSGDSFVGFGRNTLGRLLTVGGVKR